MEAIRKAGANVEEIVLAPLTREDLARLITDSFHCEPERATHWQTRYARAILLTKPSSLRDLQSRGAGEFFYYRPAHP